MGPPHYRIRKKGRSVSIEKIGFLYTTMFMGVKRNVRAMQFSSAIPTRAKADQG
jgi:hypothetical protein